MTYFKKITNYATYDIVYSCVSVDGKYTGSMYTVVEGCILRVIPNLQHRSNKKFAKNQAKNKSVTNVIHFC